MTWFRRPHPYPTIPLPAAPEHGASVTVTLPLGSPPITITTGGRDSIGRPGGARATVVLMALQVVTLQYDARTATWLQLEVGFPLPADPRRSPNASGGIVPGASAGDDSPPAFLNRGCRPQVTEEQVEAYRDKVRRLEWGGRP